MRRTFLKLAALAVSTAVLAGCAASGVKHDAMAASMPGLKSGEGRIYFYRSASMMGAAIQPDIWLNGTVVGTSRPGGFFFVDRPAGNYVAGASTETEKTLTFTVQPGETKYVRSHISMGIVAGRAILELEPPEKARGELGSLSFTGTTASN